MCRLWRIEFPRVGLGKLFAGVRFDVVLSLGSISMSGIPVTLFV